jgi:hypothetical protein
MLSERMVRKKICIARWKDKLKCEVNFLNLKMLFCFTNVFFCKIKNINQNLQSLFKLLGSCSVFVLSLNLSFYVYFIFVLDKIMSCLLYKKNYLTS